MKKALLYGLSLALLLSLAACGRPRADQPDASRPDPAATSAQADTSAPEPAAQEPTTPEQLSDKTEQAKSEELQEITHEELLKLFQEQYDISKDIFNSDSEDTIQSELYMIRIIVENMPKALPSDYEAQYRAWRPSVTQQEQNTQQSDQQPTQQEQTGKPSGNTGTQTQQPTQQAPSDEDRGTTEVPSNFNNLSPDEAYTGIDDPWENADKITIGYGD